MKTILNFDLNEFSKLKIALVKQEVYSDLYVVPASERKASTILFSSAGRVGPIGLFTELNTDFYIVKEELAPECQFYRRVIPRIAQDLQLLKTKTLDKLPNQSFKKPGSPKANGEFAVRANTVDWGKYDIVISINIALPSSELTKYPKTLFCHMIGEGGKIPNQVLYDYDVSLNQQTHGRVSETPGLVDFPYTFVEGYSLQKLFKQYLFRASKQDGVFVEINSCPERPVQNAPKIFESLGLKLQIHDQLIKNNLSRIYDSKYFVKWGGRQIRGNSAIEAISLGTLVLIPHKDILHKEILGEESDFRSFEELKEKIQFFESNPEAYQQALEEQKRRVSEYCFVRPMTSLKNILEYKRKP